MNLLTKLFYKPQLQSAALVDDRPVEEKEKDYKLDELVASADTVNWQEKPRDTWKSYPIFDQNGSGSCVAQTLAKMMGINYALANNGEYVHFSATHIYQRRKNKPQGGMYAVDALSLATEGVTLEDLVPSQRMTDNQMDGIQIPDYKKRVGDIFKVDNYVQFNNGDMETVASTIQKTGKGVMVWFYFDRDEWTNTPTELRSVPLNGANTVRHSVTAVDYTIYNGKKGLIIEDSWGLGYGWAGQRFISEDFFKARNFFSGYILDFDFAVQDTNKPTYTFTKTLRFSAEVTYGDKEVIALQDCLKYLGHFPINVESTGYFGSVTKKAVQKFQTAQGLTADGIVGKNTRSALNKIFA